MTRRQRQVSLLLVCLVLIVLGMVLRREYQNHQKLEQSLISLKPLQEFRQRLTWLPDDQNTARALEQYRREEIQDQYLRSLEEIHFATQSQQNYGLKTYFQGSALQDAQLAAQNTARLVTWRHRLRLHFYAPDGATVAFTDQSFVAESFAPGETKFYKRDMDVIMLLDDGNWRIHHWRVTKVETTQPQIPQQADLSAQLSKIRGMNYVGKNKPFAEFWQEDDPNEVSTSFAVIKRLNLNTVRIFIPFPLPPRTTQILSTLLKQAERFQLKLIITLLDNYTTYQLEELPKITAQLESLLPLLKHPAVLALDLKNEAERDAKKATWGRIRDMLSWLASWLRYETKKPITAGLTQPDLELSRSLDFVTLHHYGTVPALAQIYEQTKPIQKPVLLEEFGFHTQINKLPDPHTELEQAEHYQAILQWAAQEKVGFLAWTLHDFPAGAMPGQRQVERHLGIMRQDGTLKPAARVLLGEPALPSSIWDKLGKIQALTPILVWLIPIGLLIGWWFFRKRPINSKQKTL